MPRRLYHKIKSFFGFGGRNKHEKAKKPKSSETKYDLEAEQKLRRQSFWRKRGGV